MSFKWVGFVPQCHLHVMYLVEWGDGWWGTVWADMGGTRVLHCITDHFLMDTGDLCKQSQRTGLYPSHIAQLQSGPSENLHIFYLCQFYSCASLEHINWTADAFWNTIELPLNLVPFSETFFRLLYSSTMLNHLWGHYDIIYHSSHLITFVQWEYANSRDCSFMHTILGVVNKLCGLV